MANKTYRRFYVVYQKVPVDKKIPVRTWAEENRKYFPRYKFTNRTSDFPITHEIARVLVEQLGCEQREENGNVYLIMKK